MYGTYLTWNFLLTRTVREPGKFPESSRTHKHTLFLQADEAWMKFVGLHGPLQLLISEQEGVLVGPRPEKPPPMSQESTVESQGLFKANGSVLPEQLVKFLQSIGKGSNLGF